MKLKFLIAVCGAIALISATNHSTSKYRVRTQYHIHKVTFDGHEEVYGGITDTFYYTADGNKDKGKITPSSVMLRNKRGQIDSVAFKDAAYQTVANKYFYDDNGYLIEERIYTDPAPNLFIKYKIINGNRVEERWTYSPSADTIMMPNPTTGEMEQVVRNYYNDIFHNEFFADKLNMPIDENFGYTNADSGYTNPDKDSKNLKKKSVQLTEKGDTADVFFFRYVFDEKERVISRASISQSGNEYDSTAYTYY
jgi:hypothetical protein